MNIDSDKSRCYLCGTLLLPWESRGLCAARTDKPHIAERAHPRRHEWDGTPYKGYTVPRYLHSTCDLCGHVFTAAEAWQSTTCTQCHGVVSEEDK